MATTWSVESNTQAISTTSTLDTSITLDDRKSFILKNKSGTNRFKVDNATGNATVAGDLYCENIDINGDIIGTLSTAAQGNITSLGTLTTLTVDNIIVNGTTIGHTSDTDLLTLASGTLTVAGTLDLGSSSYMTLSDNEIDVSSGDLTIDAAGEINLDADGAIWNLKDNGTTALICTYSGVSGMLIKSADNKTLKLHASGILNLASGLHANNGIILNTKNGEIDFKSDSTTFANLQESSGELVIKSGSTPTTALTFSGADINVAGDLTVNGNDIKSSSDATAITLGGANVFIAGDLTVTGNDIKSSSNTAMSLSGEDVEVKGDLTITGNHLTFGNGEVMFNTTDGVLAFQTPSMVLQSLSGADSQFVFYEVSTAKWCIGNDATDDTFVLTPTAATLGTSKGVFSIDTSGNTLAAGTVTATQFLPTTRQDYTVGAFTPNRGPSGATSAADLADVVSSLVTDLISAGILQ